MNKLIIILSVFLIGCSTVDTRSDNVLSNNAQLVQRDLQNPSVSQSGTGFVVAEAKQLLEFCIELNNQDDRNAEINPAPNSPFNANYGFWQIIYDSRNPSNNQWNKRGKDLSTDPTKNGIKPFNNAWILLKNTANPKQYAIAIRGTVGEKSSILDDALVTTIPAHSGIIYPRDRHLPIVFAATPRAEIHLGFANAAFILLFDKDKGILNTLRNASLPADAQLFITGHSQGAAIATLLHSFFYYALTDSHDRYQLKHHLHSTDSTGLLLKSYLFAQPKAGNLQYAEDFARISKDLSYVINNDLDPVPQVPLSLQMPSEALKSIVTDNTDIGSAWEQFIFWRANFKIHALENFRNHLAIDGAEHVVKLFEDKKIDLDVHYFNGENVTHPPKASSLNYTLAGQLIPLFGVEKGGNLYPMTGKKPDALLQHHATSYRVLMQQQFGKPN